MEKELDSTFLQRIPKGFRLRHPAKQSFDNIFQQRLAGSVAVTILAFSPDLIKISLWLSDLIVKLTPASVKTYILSRDLRALHNFYTSLDDYQRSSVHRYLDVAKVLKRVYDSTTLQNSRSIRYLGHALLDQVLWQKSDPNSKSDKSYCTSVFPPGSISLEFRLSRIEYMFITRGVQEFTAELMDSGEWMDTMETLRLGLELHHPLVDAGELISQIASIVKQLRPAETVQLLERCHEYPAVIRETLLQHLLDGLSRISKIKRFHRIVENTIGHISFVWHILEPQCTAFVDTGAETDTSPLALPDLSKAIFQRLKALRYPFLKKRQCRNILSHHPANGASPLSFVDHAILKDYIRQLQVPIHRLIGTEEFVMLVVTVLRNPEHNEYHMARYVCSRLCLLPFHRRNWFFYLRLVKHHPDLDDDMRLAFFEGLNNSLRVEDEGCSITQFYNDIDSTIGLESFIDHMVDVFSETMHPQSSSVMSTCVQAYALQILRIMLNDIPSEYGTRVSKKLEIKRVTSGHASEWSSAVLEQNLMKLAKT